MQESKNILYGVLLLIMEIALQAIGGSDVKDFFLGLLLGVSVAEMLVGIYVVGKNMMNS